MGSAPPSASSSPTPSSPSPQEGPALLHDLAHHPFPPRPPTLGCFLGPAPFELAPPPACPRSAPGSRRPGLGPARLLVLGVVPPLSPQGARLSLCSNESTLPMRWPKYWSFSFSIIPSKEIPGLISFRMDWLDLLATRRLERVLSNTTVQKHQFFGAQLSSQSNSHIHT